MPRCQRNDLISTCKKSGISGDNDRPDLSRTKVAKAVSRVWSVVGIDYNKRLTECRPPLCVLPPYLFRHLDCWSSPKGQLFQRREPIRSRSSSCFGIVRFARKLMPVTLPPGRFKLATKPIFAASLPDTKTTGIAVVADWQLGPSHRLQS